MLDVIALADFLGRHAEAVTGIVVTFNALAVTPLLRHIKRSRQWRLCMSRDMAAIKVKLGMPDDATES